MTELCIYQITNTVLKNDLIILVFYGIFTDMVPDNSDEGTLYYELKNLSLIHI